MILLGYNPLKENYALKEANDAKLSHKQEKYQVIYLQELMDIIILKLSTLKISARLNMKQIREENNEAPDVAKDNGATEFIE